MYTLLTYIYNATDVWVPSLPFQDIGTEGEIILGQNFLGSFYTIFDNENAQLGLAVSSSNLVTTSGPWIGDYVAPNNGGGTSAFAVILIIIGIVAVVGVIAVVVVMSAMRTSSTSAE